MPVTNRYRHITGNKRYELTNHLGNVLAIVSDRKLLQSNGTYSAHITSAQDYYHFGSIMPSRSYSTGVYRFGFNGQEKVVEIAGVAGSHTTATFWEYDTRTARRWNLDPVVKPWISSYHAFSNNSVAKIDPNGDDDDWVETKNEKGKSTVKWDSNVTGSTDSDLKVNKYIGKTAYMTDVQSNFVYGDQYEKTHNVAPLREVIVRAQRNGEVLA